MVGFVPEPDELDGIRVPVIWVGADELPVLLANQFVAQVEHGEIFLTVGQLTPPAIMGATEEERRQQVENLSYVAVKPVARLAMTPSRLRELISVLDITLRNHEAQSEIQGDPRAGN
jgi:hypothetical protein